MNINLKSLKSFALWVIVLSASPLYFDNTEAIAQAGEVPNPDQNGDFKTAFQQGNRGFYTINKWLVVQPSNSETRDAHLNCRFTPNGVARSQIARGAIMTAVFKGDQNPRKPNLPPPSDDAIAFDSDGLPWLRVKGLRDELTYPLPVRPLINQLGECYVRANLKYIAPINPDSMNSYSEKKTCTYYRTEDLACNRYLQQWLSLR
jgi:hypothetical protein